MQAGNRAREELKRASAMMVLWNDAQLGGTLVMIPPFSSPERQREVAGRTQMPRSTELSQGSGKYHQVQQ